MRYDDYRDEGSTRNGFRRFGRWLATRPIESWGFFAAGVVVARILF